MTGSMELCLGIFFLEFVSTDFDLLYSQFVFNFVSACWSSGNTFISRACHRWDVSLKRTVLPGSNNAKIVPKKLVTSFSVVLQDDEKFDSIFYNAN